MPVKKVTKGVTEGDIEARIQGALEHAFPWLPSVAIKHQTKFTFTFGRSTFEVDGASVSRLEGRADVLVSFDDQPLAILELKRPSLDLTAADVNQGLSYARMLHPRPPLVVVTNGTVVKLLETHTGAEWKPLEPSEVALSSLFHAASNVAAADLKHAVEVLLGPTSTVWVEAIRNATKTVISDMTGAWDEAMLPFVNDFVIPRAVTQSALAALRESRIVIVEGAPLVGKSNVLRELAIESCKGEEFAFLYVEADAGAGGGILQSLANMLSDTLAWQVTRDEVRAWLRHISVSQGPSLVVAVDGLGSDCDRVRRDVEELTSGFGVKVRVILALDDTVVDSVAMSPSRRKLSAIGRQARRVEVHRLSDSEYEGAQRALWEQRLAIMPGGVEAEEFRVPWVLRAVAANAFSGERKRPEGVFAVAPALLGTEIIGYARERFKDQVELRRTFREIARAILEESCDQQRPVGLVLESLTTFMVRRTTLSQVLDRQDLDELVRDGLIRQTVHVSGESIFVARLPELVAAELATELANDLVSQLKSKVNPAESLSRVSRVLLFGEVIAAQALLDAALELGGLPMDVLSWFLNTPPTQKPAKPGTSLAMHIPGTGLVDLQVQADGSIEVKGQGRRFTLEVDASDPVSLSDIHNWLIMSHVVSHPLGVQSNDGSVIGRIDQALMLEIGTCPIVLRRPRTDGPTSCVTHNIPGHGEIACHRSGIIEPITMSMFKFLNDEGAHATGWIEQAIERKSLPLLYRIHLALHQLENSADKEKADWAIVARRDFVEPALEEFPPMQC